MGRIIFGQLRIQTIKFRINNRHLLCSYYSQLKKKKREKKKKTFSVFQNYLYFQNLFAFVNNNNLIKGKINKHYTKP